MITEHEGKYHLRLNNAERSQILDALREIECQPIFFASSKADLFVVLDNLDDAIYLALIFAP